ncbi:hypothetical protein FOA52_014679 [Chlamydomonas sp. UWO 241]|nr:hypothetical protein FOA52_014679 [Chlamydomonas sp. UWO 241]
MSRSQVDPDTWAALPEDIRCEQEAEWRRHQLQQQHQGQGQRHHNQRPQATAHHRQAAASGQQQRHQQQHAQHVPGPEPGTPAARDAARAGLFASTGVGGRRARDTTAALVAKVVALGHAAAAADINHPAVGATGAAGHAAAGAVADAGHAAGASAGYAADDDASEAGHAAAGAAAGAAAAAEASADAGHAAGASAYHSADGAADGGAGDADRGDSPPGEDAGAAAAADGDRVQPHGSHEWLGRQRSVLAELAAQWLLTLDAAGRLDEVPAVMRALRRAAAPFPAMGAWWADVEGAVQGHAREKYGFTLLLT